MSWSARGWGTETARGASNRPLIVRQNRSCISLCLKSNGDRYMAMSWAKACVLALVVVLSGAASVSASTRPPWMNPTLGPDSRAALVVQQMTRVEKLSMVFGWLGIPPGANPLGALMGNKTFHDVIGSSGYLPGIARLGIPALQETDHRFRCDQHRRYGWQGCAAGVSDVTRGRTAEAPDRLLQGPACSRRDPACFAYCRSAPAG